MLSIIIRPKFSTSTPTAEQDLSARLRSLRNSSSSPSPSPSSKPKPKPILSCPDEELDNKTISTLPSTSALDPSQDDPIRNPYILETDDRTLDELLAELGQEHQWTLDPEEPNDIQRLLDEARGALPSDETTYMPQSADSKTSKPDDNIKQNPLTHNLDITVFSIHDEDEEEADTEPSGKSSIGERIAAESREAQDIVARILDEVNLEKANQPSDSNQGDNQEDGVTEFSLPSAPSTLPEPTPKSDDFESDILARMAALRMPSSIPPKMTDSLGLPSAPTFKPTNKPINTVPKKFTDDEIDAWCIICQDDATVKCLGCDGDLYCAICWKEGHMGPDVGLEEKTHKWTKYRKPN